MMPAESDTSSLFSLSDSIRRDLFRLEGQRRRQNSVPLNDYYWPCDTAAVRMELACAAITDTVYENGLFPDETGELEQMLSSGGGNRALDLESGTTSSWTISMATKYPNVEVIGVDLIPPDLSYLPSNLSIEVHDLLDGLPYPDEFFTLIHGRATSIPSFFDPDKTILPELSRILRPGGVLLLEEIEDAQFPFFSRTLDNPHLALVRARHALRVDLIAIQTPEAIPRMDWGMRMADEMSQTLGFRIEDGGSVEDRVLEIPVGYSPQAGRPESQLGSFNRSLFLWGWQMHDVSLGLDEEMIQSNHALDEMAVSETDVGVYNRHRLVSATKGYA